MKKIKLKVEWSIGAEIDLLRRGIISDEYMNIKGSKRERYEKVLRILRQKESDESNNSNK